MREKEGRITKGDAATEIHLRWLCATKYCGAELSFPFLCCFILFLLVIVFVALFSV